MRIYLKNQDLSVTFQYENSPRVTKCIIKDISNDESFNEAKTIAIGQVSKSKKDSDVKFIARKYALSKALKSTSFSKEERRVIWNQYLLTVKIPL
jgi:hypothetical protein